MIGFGAFWVFRGLGSVNKHGRKTWDLKWCVVILWEKLSNLVGCMWVSCNIVCTIGHGSVVDQKIELYVCDIYF